MVRNRVTKASFLCDPHITAIPSGPHDTTRAASAAPAAYLKRGCSLGQSFARILTLVAPIRSVPKILTVAPTLPELACALTKGPSPIDQLNDRRLKAGGLGLR